MIENENMRLQCIKCYGFHRDGLRAETVIKMSILLVRPILGYEAQVLNIHHYLCKP